jgi:predicted nucleic acid-binding protein
MSADFFDSNVLVYTLDNKNTPKQRIAQALVNTALAGGSGCISFQVVQETLNIAIRKFQPLLQPTDAEALLRSVLMPLCAVMPSQGLYQAALDVQARWRYSFYDSLIVAAALQAGCERLLTEDLQHGQQIDGLRIENPFLAGSPVDALAGDTAPVPAA